MQLTSTTWSERLLLAMLLGLVAMSVLEPMASNTLMPNLGDMVNHIVGIIQAKIALSEGQFPLRVAPVELSGWRYPFYQFYSPSSYTLAAFIYKWFTPSNPYVAYKATIWLAMFIGGIYMYRLASWLTQSTIAATLAAIAYLTSPYNIIVINHVGAFNEAISIGILPLVLFYTLRCYYHLNAKTFLQTAIAWYAMATIHLITFLYTAFFIAFFLLLLTMMDIKRWRSLITVGVAFSFAILLAFWYLVPVVLLGKYFWVQNTISSTMFHLSRVPFLNLISPGASIADSPNIVLGVHPSIGLPVMMGAGICLYAMMRGVVLERPLAKSWFYCLFVTLVLAFLMTWSPINFWKWLPPQTMVLQYTWRLLGQMMWIGSLLFAWSICWLFKNKLDVRHAILGVLLVIVATRAWLPVVEVNYVNFSAFVKKPEFYYNSDSYVIDEQRYLKQIDVMDRVILEPSAVKDETRPGVVKLDLAKLIPLVPFNLGAQPFVLVRGQVPQKHVASQEMLMFVNGTEVARSPLKSGKFEWLVPLGAIPLTSPSLAPYYLQFKPKTERASVANKIQHQHDLSIEKIVLTGFLKPTEILNLDQMRNHCRLQKETTTCEIYVPKGTRLIELPILYYPQLLRVILNGKPAPYLSVMRDDRVMVGIIPEQGQTNVIQIAFRGLAWANAISRVAWALAACLFLLALISFRPVFFKVGKSQNIR
ncbi:MAG: 6-pyruvoyl-tetrahydropterin synthase-related protein [Gammaproteobacteria bacterium]|nr:6-pyruvoyl-tetrahydropterin synthase-related protein [Gammaproteobacteria bacterium]